jgi:hypothetical protein
VPLKAEPPKFELNIWFVPAVLLLKLSTPTVANLAVLFWMPGASIVMEYTAQADESGKTAIAAANMS